MKKMMIVGIVLLAALSLSAKGAKKKAKVAPPPAEGSRAAFEVPFAAAFAGKTALPLELCDGGLTNASEWTFALPVEDDARLRFIRATLRDGVFEKGTLHYYGLAAQPLTADEFAALRAKYPMAAASGGPGEPVRLLAPTAAKWKKSVSLTMRYSLRISPLSELYGALLPELPRLGAKAGGVSIRVDFTCDGKTETLGTVRNAKKQDSLEKDANLKRLGELTGLVSTRERIDYLQKGSLTYVPVGEEISLFDGKTLNGWRVVGGENRFAVEDGCIRGEGVPSDCGINTFLVTEREYGDFDLTVEFLCTNGNSGVQFRSHTREKYDPKWDWTPFREGLRKVFGYQAEITPSGGNVGRIYDEERRGYKNGVVWLDVDTPTNRAATAASAFRKGDWNTMRVRCQGTHIQTWVNGCPVADFRDDFDARGFIGLQMHLQKPPKDGKPFVPGFAKFRNIRLRELPRF